MNKTIYRTEIILPSVQLQGEKKQTYAMLVEGKNFEGWNYVRGSWVRMEFKSHSVCLKFKQNDGMK